MNGIHGVTADECGRFDEAACWLARWRGAPESGLPEGDLDQWAQWQRDPANRAAYETVQVAMKLGRQIPIPMKPTREDLDSDAFDGSMPVAEWLKRTRLRDLDRNV